MKVEIKEHTKKWQQMFKSESDKIQEFLGDGLIDMYHIGSTSVGGLKAKPIIDIMLVVKKL